MGYTVDAINTINGLRKWSIHSKRGAVMIKCFPSISQTGSEKDFFDYFSSLLVDVDVYYPKNPKHFWMGRVFKPHITIHHGFELNKYEEAGGGGEEAWRKDIETILLALDKDFPDKNQSFMERLLYSQFKGTPAFFPPNPDILQEGEDEYYTLILKIDSPSLEMEKFREALLKVFPHTSNFSNWSVHMSLTTVANKKSRDYLLDKLNETYVNTSGLKLGYNITR